MREDIFFRLVEFPHDGRSSGFRPRHNLTVKRLRANGESLAISCFGIHVQRDGVTPGVFALGEFKPPQQLRHADKQAPLREMNPGANPSARPVAVMVSDLKVGRVRVFRRQEGPPGEAIGIEYVGVGEPDRIVMKAPHVDGDHRAFRERHPVDHVLCGGL